MRDEGEGAVSGAHEQSEACSADPTRLTRKDAWVAAGLFLFLVLLFGKALFGPAEWCLGRPQGDARSQFYCWRAYAFNELREGRFPLWNPYEFLGMPFVAGLQSGLFYPANWLCAVLPLGLGVNLGIVLNLFLSGLFTYLWCRSLGISWAGAAVAAATYAFGAPQLLRVFEGHWSFLCSMTWIPCILLCVERLFSSRFFWPAVAGGAAGVAMQLFGGNPQYALYGGVATVVYGVVRWLQERRRVRLISVAGGFVAMYGLGVVLAGVQLVPALEFLARSSRHGQLSLAWISQYSLVPESLATLVIPDLMASDISARYWGRFNLWEMSAYVGIVSVALAALALVRRRHRFCLAAAGIALLMLLLALGKYTPLQAVFYYGVPGFRLFRVWARFLCPFSLFVGLMAGMGLDAFLDTGGGGRGDASGRRRRRMEWFVWMVGIVGVLLAVGGLLFISDADTTRRLWTWFMDGMMRIGADQRLYLRGTAITPAFKAAALHDAGLSALRSGVFLFGVAAVLWLTLRFRKGGLIPALALLALVTADVWTFSRRYLLTFDPADRGLTPGVRAFLEGRDALFRYARGGCYGLPDAEGMRHGFCSLEGIQPNVPARFRDVFWSFQGMPKNHQTTFYRMRTIASPLRMLNLRYLVQFRDNPKTAVAGLRTVYEDERFRVDELPHSWPRCWLVHNAAVVENSDEMLGLLGRFDYERQVLLEAPPAAPLAPARRPEPLPRVVHYESNRVVIEAAPSAAAFLVLSDQWYPGWVATVDGRPTTVVRANYVMRGVHVPAGRHTIEFRYRPGSFRVGVGLSLAGCAMLAFVAGLGLLTRKKRQQARGADGTPGTE